MLSNTTTYVEKAYTGELSALVSSDCRTMSIRFEGYAGYERVLFPNIPFFVNTETGQIDHLLRRDWSPVPARLYIDNS